MWLPAGGHIDPDEDPVQAVVREVHEETRIDAVVVPAAKYGFDRPAQLPPPLIILVEDIPEGPHQHIDMVYALRPVSPGAPLAEEFLWVPEAALMRNDPVDLAACGVSMPLAEDVRVLALETIRTVREATTQR
jgi:8-oxo-dGTP pyrophosphatase MutT (NUDIX family)